MADYKVIVIGGRPAGASLAIRLGRHNIKTLLVDKATFPSLPSVPSSSLIYSHHIDMLEELGISENELFYADARIDTFMIEFANYFQKALPANGAGIGRPYAYGADRKKFDMAIWDHASKYDSVTVRSGFAVTRILKENGKVTGIRGQTERGQEESFTADLVVGADGRFSFAAQQFGAAIIEEFNDYITNSYYAVWENVADDIKPHTATMYNTGKGFAALTIPIDTRKYNVGIALRPEHQKAGQRLEDYYLESLQWIAPLMARLKDAKRVTPVVGVKGIRNGYRQPVGDGWALVGDAYHYKDPLDGQGIYDALLEAKLLGEAIHQWLNGGKSWQDVSAQYAEQALAATRPMLLHTVGRIKAAMLSDPPPLIIKTLIRWLYDSAEYHRDFMRLVTRVTDPQKWQTPGVVRRAILRGIANDLFRRKEKPVAQLVTAEKAR